MTPLPTLLTVLMTSSLSLAAPWYGSRQVVARQQCSIKYEVRTETVCSTRYEEQCRQEYDTVLDTVYVDQCRDVVTQHCRASNPHHKREAEPGYGKLHNNLQCFSKPHRQCFKKPLQTQREECRQEYDTVVETTYVEQCRDVVSQHCSPVPAKVHRGYGKREAEPGYGHGGYSVRPVCRQKVERRCEKVPQQESRQVARPVCQTVVDTTYVEECQETLTTECRESQGYGKREAEAGYYRPVCEKKVERQCERVPRQQSRQVARPVCEKVPREECQEVKVKVPRKVCEEYGYSVHH